MNSIQGSSKKTERFLKIFNVAISLIFGFFLIGLGVNIIDDLDNWYSYPEYKEYSDYEKSEEILKKLQLLRREVNVINEKIDQLNEAYSATERNYNQEKESFQNWLETRKTLGNLNQDPEILSRLKKLDNINALKNAWRTNIDMYKDSLNSIQKAETQLNGELQKLKKEASFEYYSLLENYDFKIFIMRLAFAAPILSVGVYLFLKKRNSRLRAFVWGYFFFSLYVFFIGLIPYLPSYGGYIRYIVGIILTFFIGYYIIKQIAIYQAKKESELKKPSETRMKEIEHQAAVKSYKTHSCPSCEKDYSLRNMTTLINYYARNNVPFIFVIDYELQNPIILPIEVIKSDEILYDFDGKRNYVDFDRGDKIPSLLSIKPIDFDDYNSAFNFIQENQRIGNSYLTNLTFPTRIEMDADMKEIFYKSKAKYKLWIKNKFVVFSPEIFIEIVGNTISSYPMKGTIDASIANAEKIIMEDSKESAEHLTIVDLIRNDLSIVGNKTIVEKYRYVDRIISNKKELLQVSSKISASLEKDYKNRLGEIIYSLLPAGSISGAPKRKTLELIKFAEKSPRGYYTGVCGYFDKNGLKSGVMIRFIEKKDDKYYYRSGGGITIYSDVDLEYKEMLDKVYIPIN